MEYLILMEGIKIDNVTNQFIVRRGDFFVTDTDLQDQKEIIYANKGNFLESPSLGVGIANYSNSPLSKPELERLIRKELEKDSVNVVTISVKQVEDDFDIILKTSRIEE